MPPTATIADALAILRDEDRFEEHEEAENLLLSLERDDTVYVPLLADSIRNEGCGGRFWILLALKRIAPEDPAVAAVMANCSRDPDEQVRGEAIAFLSRYGAANRDIAIPALARAARLRPTQDYVSNAVKAFVALVRLAGWKGVR